MKNYILLFCLILLSSNYLYGAFIPLDQYNTKSAEISQIPDRYLFATFGILTAMNFECSNKELLIRKFNNLSVDEQYHVIYLLSALQKDQRIKEHLIPSFNTIRRRNKEKSFDETFAIKIKTLWNIFINSLDKDSHKTTNFYKYANKISLAINSNCSEDEQLYVVALISLASQKKLINATEMDRMHVIEHIVNVINKLTSKSAKNKLTYDFIHFMNAEQVANLNTTVYAILLSIPKVLYYGKFINFFPIYMNILEHTDPIILKNMQIVDELNYYFPGYNWTSITDAISFIKKHIKNLHFDNKRRKYYYIRGDFKSPQKSEKILSLSCVFCEANVSY